MLCMSCFVTAAPQFSENPDGPTVVRRAVSIFFSGNEGLEPLHIHIQRGEALAKFWLDSVEPFSSTGFAGHGLRRLQARVEERRAEFEDAWNDLFRP